MSDLHCDHCQEIIVTDYQLILRDETKHFCCQGCQHVYQILNQNNLTQFYQLSQNEKIERPQDKIEDYRFLDDEEFRKKYLANNKFEFYVEGIHCIACLWLLEKLPELVPGVSQAKLNMSSAVVSLEVDDKVKLSDVASMIARLGYRPHPIMQKDDAKKLQEKENQKALIQIAVAFACMGNIMLYALAIYAGAEGKFKDYFNLFSFFCIIPVVFYASIPFYQSALGAIKTKTLSIDIPIVVAIIIGFFMGVFSLIYNKDYFYFDTIATLVFLLLSARFILKRMQQKSLGQADLKTFFATKSALKIENGLEKPVLTKFLQIGDTVKILKDQVIPIDGEIIKGESYINNSLISGEVYPVCAKIGMSVFMGAKNLSEDILIKVSATSDETRLGKILEQIESGWRTESKISIITDKISKRFVIGVFLLATFFFIYFLSREGIEIALERTLTLLLITCPCALALTTPMALILGLSQMARQGVIVKNELVIEKLASAKKIFLDKTGTLTTGHFKINEKTPLSLEHINIIYSLEKNANHPIGQSLKEYLFKHYNPTELEIEQVKEIPGLGVEGVYQDKKYVVKSVEGALLKSCALFCENEIVAEFSVEDELRAESVTAIRGFKKHGITPIILSGDQELYVKEIASILEITDYYSQVSPETKNEIIQKNSQSIMVGDGLNDALALKSAFVGIAVRGSVDVALRASDVYLSRSKIDHILGLVLGSRYILNIIYRNLTFSLFYNLIGIYMTWIGAITPLVAAILMPLSSLTVLASTLFGTKRLKNLIS